MDVSCQCLELDTSWLHVYPIDLLRSNHCAFCLATNVVKLEQFEPVDDRAVAFIHGIKRIPKHHELVSML